MAREREEELALFHDMRKRERARKNALRGDPMEAARLGSWSSSSSSLYRMAMSLGTKAGDDFMASDAGKNDYDWSAASSRSSTPSRRPVLPQTQTQAAGAARRSPSVSKASSLPTRSTSSSRGTSRLWQPSEMPGFSLEPPPNLRTTLPERTTSNPRSASPAVARLGGTTPARATQVEASDAATRSRRQPCSPSVTRGKMVEQVMQSRRAAAADEPRQAAATMTAQAGKRLSAVKSVLATTKKEAHSSRTNSWKQLTDTAPRLVDFRQSASNRLKPLSSNPTGSSFHSAGRARTASSGAGTESSIASSSTASSDQSMSVLGDHSTSSEGGTRTKAKDVRIHKWMASPHARDDDHDDDHDSEKLMMMKLVGRHMETLACEDHDPKARFTHILTRGGIEHRQHRRIG